MKSLVMESLAMLRAEARRVDRSGFAEEAGTEAAEEERTLVLASEVGAEGGGTGGVTLTMLAAAGCFPLFSSQ